MSEHTWNHRVIRTVTNDEEFLQIHEVHYTDGVPKLVTSEPISVGGETIEEMKETLNRMIKCLDKDIIDMSYFDNLPQEDPDEVFGKSEKSFKTKEEFEAWLDELEAEDKDWLDGEEKSGC